VEIIVTGTSCALKEFRHALVERAPPLARPHIESVSDIAPRRFDGFRIVASRATANAKICLPPDYFMCDGCLGEQQDPANRRYRYPFINCTQCGPRYTLIEKLPYDRVNTSMAKFVLCDACRAEYSDPLDRRFHAEPVACPACGPQVFFRSCDGQHFEKEVALREAIAALRAGQIVAVKGVGGYHLMCDARNAQAVRSLRRRKQRPHKPLAVMLPRAGSDGLSLARKIALLSRRDAAALLDTMRPIVLCRKRGGTTLAEEVAPGLGEVGLFLPYSPLHELLLGDFGGPLVATSGNLSGEPVLTAVADAEQRLARVADASLHHDRPIVRPADDPVYRRIGRRMRPIRIGRGSAPRELKLPWSQPVPTLAVGGHMKGTIALSWDDRVVISPHIGEMDSPRSLEVFRQLAGDLQRLYKVCAEKIVCDAHPGYATHRLAKHDSGLPYETLWHHRAHASALAAEYAAAGAWLVFGAAMEHALVA
jgi:hydrogenase maturation protein HypF